MGTQGGPRHGIHPVAAIEVVVGGVNAEVEDRDQGEVQEHPHVIGKAGVGRVEAEHVGFQLPHPEMNEDSGPQESRQILGAPRATPRYVAAE